MKNKFAVPVHHQTALRLLLSQRAIAQAEHKAAAEASQAVLNTYQAAIHEFLTVILEEADLDPKLYGIDRTLAKFVLLPPPASNPQLTVVPSPDVAQDVPE